MIRNHYPVPIPDSQMEYIITAVITLVGNLLSGPRGSKRWELVSAMFGWVGAIAMFLWFLNLIFGLEFWKQVLFPVFAFFLTSALVRDYEKILKPNT